ncbi:MAG: DNA polymerase III subunit gamma/tau [Candidatus Omnitrophica bacterium]|nr:DNA polymerase III subunit gamma/tau [Candidatus Omnitrophota bacterium]
MSYVVFARKWRPQTFDDVIGQDHVVTTLKNAIKNDRVAHAYLFSGPRGVGKTTTARIFAKSLNCEKGPITKPCGKCPSCNEISKSISMDVIEIDGASNRGIDEIRSLRENVKFMPSHGKFKIYIIDEVHQITTDGFNALLKTLEEPPKHVKFIFATTRPGKVLATILSRCQRFDFKRIQIKMIISKLKSIAASEKLKVSDDALMLVARAAEGSMRDAESILDQLVAYCDKRIDVADVSSSLGMVEEDALLSMSDILAKKDAPAALKWINQLLEDGKDLVQFLSSLIDHFRSILMAKIGKDAIASIELGADSIERISKHSEKFTLEEIIYILQTLSNTHYIMKHSESVRLPLELALLRLARRQDMVDLSQALDRMKDLQRSLDEGTIVATQEKRTRSQPAPRTDAGSSGGKKVSGSLKDMTGMPTPVKQGERSASTQTIETIDELADIDDNSSVATATILADPPEKGTIDEAHQQDSVSSTASNIILPQIKGVWAELINKIKEKKMSVASYLLEGEPAKMEDGVLLVTFPRRLQFHKETLEESANLKLIKEHLRDILKVPIAVELGLRDDRPEELESSRANKNMRPIAFEEDTSQNALDDPIVRSALDVFQGEIRPSGIRRPIRRK